MRSKKYCYLFNNSLYISKFSPIFISYTTNACVYKYSTKSAPRSVTILKLNHFNTNLENRNRPSEFHSFYYYSSAVIRTYVH